jgi:DNA repair and recombination protein RAD52
MTFTDSMKTELAKPLDKKNVKPPAPGKYGEYVEGWHVIDEANRIFGFDGWSRETVDMIETNRDVKGDKHHVGYRCKVRVIAHGVTREGSAFGSGVSKNLGDAIESAVKEAETDAMKRAMMTFGYPFGLALYDKTKANVDDGQPKPDPIDRPALIMDLAKAAGVTIQTICESYSVSSLNELPTPKADAVIKRLNLTIADKKKENA